MPDENQVPQTVSELFIRIARGRAELEEWMATLTPAQMTLPRKDGWSIQDHYVHLAMWEKSTAALLRGESRYAALGVDTSKLASNDFDTINAQIHTRSKTWTLDTTLEFFHNAHMELLDELAKMSDADLQKPFMHFQPGEPRDDNHAPIINWIAGNTYEHYAEHAEWIREMLAS
jgi:hypothetical protein